MKFVLKLLFLLFAFRSSTVMAQTSSRIICDENCKTESGATAVKGDGFAVVSPVGRGTVQMIGMALRLNSLAGKTLAIGSQNLDAGTYKFSLSIGGTEYGYNATVNDETTGSLSLSEKYIS